LYSASGELVGWPSCLWGLVGWPSCLWGLVGWPSCLWGLVGWPSCLWGSCGLAIVPRGVLGLGRTECPSGTWAGRDASHADCSNTIEGPGDRGFYHRVSSIKKCCHVGRSASGRHFWLSFHTASILVNGMQTTVLSQFSGCRAPGTESCSFIDVVDILFQHG
jgi:hypothetical protein